MHRHSFTGRKLSLQTDQRRALVRGLVTSLVLYEQIKTTEAKAKEIAPQFERMVTKAKQGTLASNRALRAFLLTDNAVKKMILEIAPAMADRNGGYTRIVKLENRRGDNAPMVQLSLVLPESGLKPAIADSVDAKKATKAKAPAKKAVTAGADNA